MNMNMFARLTKIDAEKRLVFGRLAEEVVDKSDEIFDYALSKPYFKAWNEEFSKDTDGKSCGALRAMHGKVAAGKFIETIYDDVGKTIDVVAKVVDDNEWKKCLEGVYRGFSVGGSYVGEKKIEKFENRDIKRYVAKPTEGSLVDSPCMYGAKFFEVQKADGTLEQVEFQKVDDEIIEDDAGVVEGTAEQVDQLTKLMADNKLDMGKVLEVVAASLVKVDPPIEKADDAVPKGIGPEKWASMSADEKAKYKAGVAAGTEPDGDEATKLAKVAADEWNDTLTKLEGALADALTKVGARNNAADKNRINAIHNAAAELGADCPMTGKAAPAADLQKVDTGAELQKLLDEKLTPLQKLIEEQQAKITKLEEQPAPSRIKLRAVSKGEDFLVDDGKKEEVAKVKDSHGDEHETASLIKAMHKQGGAPLHVLNK